ncbi:MAG TPA: tetratricopeptide repeat protein [Pyrinomonadaceae bacterium]|nr:tetratricopeptide repeat protein [Pyrinomonadaceae bacterium]
MITLNGFSFTGTLVRILLFTGCALLLSQAEFASARSQNQVKSKIEQEIERKNAPVKQPENEKKARSSSAHKRSIVNESAVTIFSEVPGTDIFLDGTLVGKIDQTKKVTTKAKKGPHTITASLKGYNSQSMVISVAAERSTHTLNLGKPLPPPTPAPTPVAKVEPTPAPPPAPPPPNADDVIRRFINPKESTEVTADDWHQVVVQTEESMKKESNGPLLARLHLARGQELYLKRNYAEALAEFNHAIESSPQSGIAFYGLGNAYLATNQPLQAQKTYQKAVQLTPEVAALAHKGIGDSLTKLLKRSEANSSYMKARDLGYVSPELNKNIARNLIDDKQWQRALTELSEIEDGDKTAEIHLFMGECFANLSRPLSAYRAYAAAAKLDPSSATAFLKLGNLLYELNEFPEAKEAYERALALDTTGNVINRPLIRKQADKAAALSNNSSRRKEGN